MLKFAIQEFKDDREYKNLSRRTGWKNKLSIEEEYNLQQCNKTVAWRDIAAKPMYIKFFSN